MPPNFCRFSSTYSILSALRRSRPDYWLLTTDYLKIGRAEATLYTSSRAQFCILHFAFCILMPAGHPLLLFLFFVLINANLCSIIPTIVAGIAQLVEQRIRNAQVACSSHVSSSKKEVTFGRQKLLLFLSKPQAWHIISPNGAVYHPSLCDGISSRHSRVSLFLRLDEIQHCVLMIYRNKLRIIYNASH